MAEHSCWSRGENRESENLSLAASDQKVGSKVLYEIRPSVRPPANQKVVLVVVVSNPHLSLFLTKQHYLVSIPHSI